MRLEVADDLILIDCFAVWHIWYVYRGNGDFPFEKPLVKRVAELTAITREFPGFSVEESGKAADL